MDDLTEDLILYGSLTAAGVAAAVGAYFLVKRYAVVGEIEFQGRRYPFTGEDKLWAGRMLVGETGGGNDQANAAVLWSVVTRWVSNPRFQDWSFTRLARAFSQPINPIWASRSASGCQRNPSACTDAHLARRQRISSMSWGSLPPNVQRLVESFAQGRVSNPIPGYNNFAAATHIGSSRLASSELPPVDVGGNMFIRDPGSLQGEVRIV